jgi:endonuclease/exonuclease/phosphatase family metal-dependent hydrolase
MSIKTLGFLRYFREVGCVLAGALLLAASAVGAEPTAGTATGTLGVMSYNLRFASPTPPNAWPQRRPLMAGLISRLAPDIIGTQEGVFLQLQDLATDLPDYAWIGLGREGGSKGEFMAVFYRRDRLEPLAFDHFWLSDTPEVIGSATWGNTYRRMVTWVKFRDRRTQAEFYFFNTHFDHQVESARVKGAGLLRQRIAALDPKLPVVLTGDFNADAGASEAWRILTQDGFLRDTWLTARERLGEGIGTFNDFKAAQPQGARIDWILTRGEVVADRIEIVPFAEDGQFPSDHFPVVTHLRLGGR